MTSRFPSYRSTYNSNGLRSRSSPLDSSSDTSTSMDVSMRSHQNFLRERDHEQDLESENWPRPLSFNTDEDYSENCEEQCHDSDYSSHYDDMCSDDCYDCKDNDSSCLCSGITMLASLLCSIYSEADDTNMSVHSSRPMTPVGGRLHACSRLLSVQMASDLYEMIPETARIAQPTLLFATYRDGWSMESLLAKTCDKDNGVILLIKAAKSQVVLGAYSTAKLSPPSTRVRGNGECFVFRLSSPAAAYRWTYVPSMQKACRNQFVVSCRDYIAFGGSEGDGSNAIRLDNDLRICNSGASDTYQNEPLVPEELTHENISSPFEVMDIEVLHVNSLRIRRRGGDR